MPTRLSTSPSLTKILDAGTAAHMATIYGHTVDLTAATIEGDFDFLDGIVVVPQGKENPAMSAIRVKSSSSPLRTNLVSVFPMTQRVFPSMSGPV
jgi:hypothetical protein